MGDVVQEKYRWGFLYWWPWGRRTDLQAVLACAEPTGWLTNVLKEETSVYSFLIREVSQLLC